MKRYVFILIFGLVVTNAAAAITVLNYPNPFNPAAGQTTSIEYSLGEHTDITIYIFNPINHLIKKISCPKATTGGSSGYNQVPWDGYTDFSELAANDVYIARVVAGGRQIGKCKIVVLK
jgi:hypothetical protein